MKYISAYALVWLGGKLTPTVKDLEIIINSIGGDFDKEYAEVVIKALTGKDVPILIRDGLAKLQISRENSTSAELSENNKNNKKKQKIRMKSWDSEIDDECNIFFGEF